LNGAADPVLVAVIDALLPQTQCGQCGHPGCLPYAEAMAAGEVIDRCPPGGDDTVRALARLLGRPEHMLAGDLPRYAGPRVAVIDEARCIGCARCLPVCPVDAIVGAAKWMHTVIEDHCTGCERCVAPCPVDCIQLVPAPFPMPDKRRADLARERTRAREHRLRRQAERAEERRRARRAERRPAP
jgi:electron transport complex protein RnfB